MTHSLQHSLRRAAAAMAMAAACALSSPGAARAQAVWELTPYRIQVYLAAGNLPDLTPRVLDDLATGLVDRADVVVGAAWQMRVAAAPDLLHRQMAGGLNSIQVESLPAEALGADKVTLLWIAPEWTGYRVAARELDVATRTFSPVVEKWATAAALLPGTLFAAASDVFAPLASIESEAGGKVRLRLRAGRFPARDPAFLSVAPGDVFRPIIRYDDRDGNPKRILALPWTYFAVEQVDQAELTCQMYSGLRTALAGRRRGRVHQLALAVKPPGESTRLVVRARTASKRPLCGYDIYLQKPGETAGAWFGRTGLDGSIVIPPGEAPLMILYVRNGGQLLARLPLVPGLEKEAEAVVLDDDQRLAAESAVMAAQEELVDLVTRRAVLAAQIRGAVKAGDLKSADRMLIDLFALRTRDQFTTQLAAQRQRLYSEDPIVQKHVDKMFEETRKLVVQYLDPNEIDKVSAEVREAKAAESNAGT